MFFITLLVNFLCEIYRFMPMFLQFLNNGHFIRSFINFPSNHAVYEIAFEIKVQYIHNFQSPIIILFSPSSYKGIHFCKQFTLKFIALRKNGTVKILACLNFYKFSLKER